MTTHANIFIHIEYFSKDSEEEAISFEHVVEGAFEEMATIPIGEGENFFEVIVSDHVPSEMLDQQLPMKDPIFFEVRLFEQKDDQKRVLFEHNILAGFDQQAELEVEDQNSKKVLRLRAFMK